MTETDELDGKLLAPGALDDEDVPDDWMRKMIGAARASGFDEEPAPRIDALLMAAARQHAPRPRAAWWARLADWMRPVVAHPGLAGAAALVLVAGAGGLIYQRAHVARPTAPVASPPSMKLEYAAPAPTPSAPVDTLAKHDEPRDSQAVVEERGDVAQAQVATAPTTPVEVATTKKHGRVADKPVTETQRPGTATGATAGGGGAMMIAEGPADVPMREPDAETIGAAMLDEDAVTVTDNATPRGQSATAPKAEAVADDAPASTTITSDRGSDQRARDHAQAVQLLKQARTAAKAEQCSAVKVIATRVQKLDATYYRDVFTRDADVTRCR